MSASGKKGAAQGRAGGKAVKTQLKLVTGAPALLPAGAPEFLTVVQVASMLHLTPKTIYNMVSQKRIPFRKAGHQLLFDLREIDAWTKSGADNQ